MLLCSRPHRGAQKEKTMKRSLAAVLLLLTVCVAPSLPAQTDDDVIELTRSVIQTERQALIAASKSFLPTTKH